MVLESLFWTLTAYFLEFLKSPNLDSKNALEYVYVVQIELIATLLLHAQSAH